MTFVHLSWTLFSTRLQNPIPYREVVVGRSRPIPIIEGYTLRGSQDELELLFINILKTLVLILTDRWVA